MEISAFSAGNRILVAGLLACLTAGDAIAQTLNGFDVSDALVPSDQIVRTGVPRDGILSIDTPVFLAADDAAFLRQDDRVLGVNRNGVAKAYPVRILDHHEVVNDDFAGEPIVVTWCPLCYSGMAFTVATTDSRLTFGVSGLLYNSDVLLYDRQTGSLFSQIRSQAISGPLKALKIPAVPLSHTTWRDWRTRFPDTEVLSTDTGFRRNYKVSPYLDYQRSPRLAFPVANRSSELRNKELVLGVELNGRTVAYPFRELKRQEKASFEETFGAENWLVEWSEKDEFARVVDADGNEHPTVIAYWFAWYAFHPDTEVFSAVD